MAYSTPGIDEATRQWIISQIVANVSSLNTALASDNLTPVAPATSGSVFYGDPTLMPQLPFWICVYGGGGISGGADMEVSQLYIDFVRYSSTIHSSIAVYLHPDTFQPAPNTSGGPAQVASRERLLSRICDFLRAECFNTFNAASPTLTSQEYIGTDPTQYDFLDRAHIESIEK